MLTSSQDRDTEDWTATFGGATFSYDQLDTKLGGLVLVDGDTQPYLAFRVCRHT